MSNDITGLRAHLFEAIRSVRSGELEVDKARMINELARTLTDTAKLEIDHARLTGADAVPFIAQAEADKPLPNGITSIVRHRLEG